MSRFTRQAVAMALMGYASDYIPDIQKREKRKQKPCANPNCNKLHNHNNRWCSAECCKEHRAMNEESR